MKSLSSSTSCCEKVPIMSLYCMPVIASIGCWSILASYKPLRANLVLRPAQRFHHTVNAVTRQAEDRSIPQAKSFSTNISDTFIFISPTVGALPGCLGCT